MIRKIYFILVFSFGIFGGLAQNQTSEDSLDTQTVSVVKPHTPSLSDAFKLKTWPVKPSFNSTKQPLQYTIFSAPVASTFSPAKSKSVGLPRSGNTSTFDNVASFSIGNYTNITGGVFLNYALNKRQQLHAQLNHNSSQGGLDGVVLDNAFSTNSASFLYQSSYQDTKLELKADYKRQMTHWYGLAKDLTTDILLDSNVKQTLSVVQLSGVYERSDSWFEAVQIAANALSDRYDSQEFNVNSAFDFKLNLFNISLSTTLGLDLLNGTFARGYTATASLDYNNTTVSVFPSVLFDKGDLNVSAGFGAYLFLGDRASKQQFYIVPNIHAEYPIVDAIVVTYAGIQGDLKQNTYLDLYDQNPFVAPTLNIKPTFTPFNIFLGMKGKLTHQLSYDIKGQYSKHDDFLMFQKHSQPALFNGPAYRNGNSFGVVYDNLKRFTVSAGLEGYINTEFQFRGQLQYHSFDTTSESEAWNFPNLEAEVAINWSIAPQWKVDFQAFYIGERYDFQSFEPSPMYLNFDRKADLEAIFDLNLAVHYTINERWLTQLKFNNILGQNYQQWFQYPTQGFQISTGVYYKFDF